MKKRRADEDEPVPDKSLALKHLREAFHVSRKDLAARLGLASDDLLGKYERGDKTVYYETLLANVEPLGCPQEAVDALLALYPFLRNDPVEQPPSPVALSPDELRWVRRSCLAVITGVMEELLAEQIRRKKGRKAKAARKDADERWPDLQAATPEKRRRLVETFPRYRTWAMAERVCEASIKAAANSATEALELATVALFIAERIPGEPSFRSRTEGYCWAHVANARRVGEDFNGADLAFGRAWELWNAGADSDPDLLAEWKLYSLEASLRRAQHRFPEALERLDCASERGGGDKWAVGSILLTKSSVLLQMEDPASALRVLDRSASLLEGLEDSYLLFFQRYNMTDTLCRLQRYKQAAPMIETIRSMSIERGDQLNLTRVLWLDAMVRAGLGRKDEAVALLEQVFNEWTERRHPYDAALSGLDLARLRLEGGQLAEVRGMTITLALIFEMKGIRREALAALAIFCEAAKRDAATVELAQEVRAEIERVKHSAPPTKH